MSFKYFFEDAYKKKKAASEAKVSEDKAATKSTSADKKVAAEAAYAKKKAATVERSTYLTLRDIDQRQDTEINNERTQSKPREHI